MKSSGCKIGAIVTRENFSRSNGLTKLETGTIVSNPYKRKPSDSQYYVKVQFGEGSPIEIYVGRLQPLGTQHNQWPIFN